MNELQVEKLLRLLAASFPTLKLSDDTVNAWLFALCDEDPQQILLAARHLVKTRDSAFMPTIPEVLAVKRKLSGGSFQTAEQAWADGPGCTDPHGAKVWKAFGGARRFGGLPDPKYCDDPEQAERTLSFARKEFCDLYESMRESEIHEQAALTHEEAVAFLSGPKERPEGKKHSHLTLVKQIEEVSRG